MMDDRRASRQPQPAAPRAGLCDTCRHAERITSARGSQFTLCGRSRTDPSFQRYPRLPVLACHGYEVRAG
jgi:hypothetical protein